MPVLNRNRRRVGFDSLFINTSKLLIMNQTSDLLIRRRYCYFEVMIKQRNVIADVAPIHDVVLSMQ